MTRPKLAPEPEPALEPDLDDPEPGASPRLRKVVKVGKRERSVRLDDVDDIIGIAAELRSEEAETLSLADLKEVGQELDIEPCYIERAVKALEQRRQTASRQVQLEAVRSTRLKRRLLIGGAVLVAVLAVATFWGQHGLRHDYAQVQLRRAQVRNVLERQLSVEKRYRQAPPSPERDAELSGAENRVRIERRRYDQAATEYNTNAGGLLRRLCAPLFGFPKQVPLSTDVKKW